jgi:Asp-tRNA(Asn)/Glu-tRNA(Gln) amidotransferase A subunit family amidase
MQIIAPPLQEATAIQVGCLFQQFTDWHRQQPPLTF